MTVTTSADETLTVKPGNLRRKRITTTQKPVSLIDGEGQLATETQNMQWLYLIPIVFLTLMVCCLLSRTPSLPVSKDGEVPVAIQLTDIDEEPVTVQEASLMTPPLVPEDRDLQMTESRALNLI
jgi:hypothetical protein